MEIRAEKKSSVPNFLRFTNSRKLTDSWQAKPEKTKHHQTYENQRLGKSSVHLETSKGTQTQWRYSGSPDVLQGTDSYSNKNTGHIHEEQRQNKYNLIEDENSEKSQPQTCSTPSSTGDRCFQEAFGVLGVKKKPEQPQRWLLTALDM